MNRQTTRTAALVAAAALGGMLIGQIGPVRAQVGDILKGGAIAVVVDRFSGDIDRFVNKVTGNSANNTSESTRVVPILTVGKGAYVGAVQVTGPKDLVDQVKAVAQVEADARIGSRIRVKGLIPVSARSAANLGSLSRVKGVGVSAIIDIKL